MNQPERSTSGVGGPVSFDRLTPEQRGALDPAIEYLPGTGEARACRFLDIGVDADSRPVPPDGEIFRSRWLCAGIVLYDAGIGDNAPACYGGSFLGVSAERIAGCWHNGLQWLEKGAENLGEGAGAQVAFSWRLDSISQIFVEGTRRRIRGFEATALRVFGGDRGVQLVIEAAMPADEAWLGPPQRKMPDPRDQYAALAKEIARAWAALALREGGVEDLVRARSIAAGDTEHWRTVESPFPKSDLAIVIEL